MTGTVPRRVLSPLRKDRITASRLPALLGVSPYTTPKALMRQMVREHFGDPEEFAGNIATEWGHLHEAEAIAEYELTRGIEVHRSGLDQRTLVHPGWDYFAATPDGLIADRVVEVKAPWRSLFTSIDERPDYYAQVQLQMEVTGLEFADLCVWRLDQPLLVTTVKRDRDWMAAQLFAVHQFLAEYRAVLADPELSTPHREPLRDQRVDDEWAAASAEWLELDFMVRQLEESRTAAAARLAGLSPAKSARGAGVDLVRYERPGTVSYKKVLDDLQPNTNVDKYRGKPSVVTVIRRLGAKQ